MPIFFAAPSCSISSHPCGGERQFVHGNLVALGQIGIEVIFARKPRSFLDLQIERQRSAQGQLQGAFIEDGQGAGKAQADRASVRIRRIAEARGAAAEDFGGGFELHVDFKPDDRLIGRGDFGRDARCRGFGSSHGESRDYNIFNSGNRQECADFRSPRPKRQRRFGVGDGLSAQDNPWPKSQG